jgi:hypothetical protein
MLRSCKKIKNNQMKIFVIGLEFVFWQQDAENLRPLVLGMLQDKWGLNNTESYISVLMIITDLLLFCKGLII